MPRSGESTSGTWPDSLRAELAGTVRGGQLPAPAESAELAGADACRPWPQCWAALMAQVCRGAETVAVPSGYIRCSPKPSWYERARSAIAGRGGRTPVISGGHPMLTEPAVTARAVARMAGQLLEVP